jgi:hypothetical protein
MSLTWHVPNIFNTGTFVISPAVADRTGSTMFDWVEAMAEFKVRKQLRSNAVMNAAHTITINQEKK